MKKIIDKRSMLTIALTFFYCSLYAQTSDLVNYIKPVTNITLVIGAFVAVIGGVVIYFKWTSGEDDVTPDVWRWASACVLLVVAPLVIKAFLHFSGY